MSKLKEICVMKFTNWNRILKIPKLVLNSLTKDMNVMKSFLTNQKTFHIATKFLHQR